MSSEEQMLTELQEVLADLKEAREKIEELSAAKAGDEVYDDIMAVCLNESDPIGTCKSQVDELTRQWQEEFDRLNDRESELYDALVEAGYDIASFYKDHGHIDLTDDMPASERAKVDAILESVRPTKRKVGEVEEVVPIGASGYEHNVEETLEDMSHVDVLDDTAQPMPNDAVVDVAKVYEASADDAVVGGAELKDEPCKVARSGASWLEGRRMSAELVALLKEHQIEAIELAINRVDTNTGFLIAHAMGLGKTLTILALLHLVITPERAHALLLCPKAVVAQWGDEAYKWRNVIDVATYAIESFEERAVERMVHQWQQGGGLLIVQYDQLSRVVDDLHIDDETLVILDEAHLLKTPGTQLHTAVDGLPSKKRIMLTGTPLQNNLDEYYTMAELIAPGLLGSSISQFRQSYSTVIEQGMHKDSSEADMRASERMTQVLRWQMDGVMHDMSASYLKHSIPPKKEYCVSIQFAPIDELGCPISEYHTISDVTRTRRTEVICQLIDMIQQNDSDDGIVVFSNRHETLNAIKDQRDGFLYTGSVAGAKRSSVIADFQEQGGILYISTKAGGTGLNLTRGSRVIVADVSWNPVFDTQAVARCYRMGQTKPVHVYRLVAKETLEERIYRMNVQKHAVAARIKDDTDFLRTYNREELKTLKTAPSNTTSLDAENITDMVLRAVAIVDGIKDVPLLTIIDHDSFFLDTDAQMSDAESNRALNEYYKMVAQHPRVLTPDADEEVCQTIQPRETHFQEPYETKLVPAYTPYLEPHWSGDPDKLNIIIGPSPHTEVQRMRPDDDDSWTTFSTMASQATYEHIQLYEGEEVPLTAFFCADTPGKYAFRARTIDPESGDVGPWSEVSATWILMF